METPTIKLVKSLQNYDKFKNKSEYQIRKIIGKDYGIDRARNVELMIELESLQNNLILPNEIWEEILLVSKDLDNTCFINKNTINICENKHFWYKKMTLEDLPYEWVKNTETIHDWIKNYKKLVYCKQQATRLIDYFKSFHELHPNDAIDILYYSDINDNKKIIDVLPLTMIYSKEFTDFEIVRNMEDEPEECQYVMYITLFENNQHTITYYLEGNQGVAISKIEKIINLKELYEVLMKWLFFVKNEDTDLVDMDGFSYFYNELDIQIENLPMRKSQREKLEERLLFIK